MRRRRHGHYLFIDMGDGNDTFVGGANGATYVGGARGNDRFEVYGSSSLVAFGGSGDDRFIMFATSAVTNWFFGETGRDCAQVMPGNTVDCGDDRDVSNASGVGCELVFANQTC